MTTTTTFSKTICTFSQNETVQQHRHHYHPGKKYTFRLVEKIFSNNYVSNEMRHRRFALSRTITRSRYPQRRGSRSISTFRKRCSSMLRRDRRGRTYYHEYHRLSTRRFTRCTSSNSHQQRSTAVAAQSERG